MSRDLINVPNSKWYDLVHELFFTDENNIPVEIQEIERKYVGSRRHTEHHYLIFKRVSDSKFFKIDYETSVKDSMGWDECNCGDTIAAEVYPEQQIITIYK